MGRHALLTEEMVNNLVKHVKDGSAFTTAYNLCGITKWTGQQWRVTGHKDLDAGNESLYATLVLKMDEARASFLQSLVRNVIAAGREPKHWMANLALLERRDPDNYSRYSQPKLLEDLDATSSPSDLSKKILSKSFKGEITSEEAAKHIASLGVMAKIERVTELETYVDEFKVINDQQKNEIDLLKKQIGFYKTKLEDSHHGTEKMDAKS